MHCLQPNVRIKTGTGATRNNQPSTKMVIIEVVPGYNAGVLGVALLVDVAPHGEAGGAVLLPALHRVAPGDGHVVHDPVVLVVHAHALPQHAHLLLVLLVAHVVVLGADGLALAGVLVEEDLKEKKIPLFISCQDLLIIIVIFIYVESILPCREKV